MTHIRTYIVALLTLISTATAPLMSAANDDAPQWEQISNKTTTDESGTAAVDMRRDLVEVVVRDGAIYLTADAPIKVQVYSILGQLVASKQIQQGTVRLTLHQHGVYILKAGALTRRINI